MLAVRYRFIAKNIFNKNEVETLGVDGDSIIIRLPEGRKNRYGTVVLHYALGQLDVEKNSEAMDMIKRLPIARQWRDGDNCHYQLIMDTEIVYGLYSYRSSDCSFAALDKLPTIRGGRNISESQAILLRGILTNKTGDEIIQAMKYVGSVDKGIKIISLYTGGYLFFISNSRVTLEELLRLYSPGTNVENNP